MKLKSKLTLCICVLSFVSIAANGGVLQSVMEARKERAGAESGVKKLPNISYGEDKKQRLDVYAPQNPKEAPIIVMVHGGGWRIGDKGANRVVENKVKRWIPKGAIFVSVNYRLLPEADPLKQADDVAAALAYIQTNAAGWGGDYSKIALIGHSAGAHLVSLISANPAKYPKLKPWRATVSLDSACMDVPHIMGSKHARLYDDAFGTDAAYWEAASPYHRLTSVAPPTLMVCSTKRHDKPCEDASRFAQKALSLGLRAEILPQDMTHKEINEELGTNGDYTQKVEEFLRSVGIGV